MISKTSSRKSKPTKTTNTNIDFFNAKDIKDLEEDYKILRNYIENDNIQQFQSMIRNHDNKYFLIYNDYDYQLYKLAIVNRKRDFIEAMKDKGYVFNSNMLLIEQYDKYIYDKYKISKSNTNQENISFSSDDLIYLIENQYGIDVNDPLVEFYFLLMSHEYQSAVKLLSLKYSNKIKDELNSMFIGDEVNLIEKIVMKNEIIKSAIKGSLNRKLDGIAYEIFCVTQVFIDDQILTNAIRGDCSLFLEEVWNNTKQYGSFNTFSSPKLSFSQIIDCMLKEGKWEMASNAIKYWSEPYKEDNVFEILVNKSEELAM